MRGCRGPVLLAVLAIAACTSVSVQNTLTVPQGNAAVQKIAVLPFSNLTADNAASKALFDAVVGELRRRARFEVLEAKELAKADRLNVTAAGKQLGADAVLVGVVTEYNYGPSGQNQGQQSSSNIAIDLRLFAVESRDLLWAAALTATRNQIISYDGVTLTELSAVVANNVTDGITNMGKR